ncbi:MAG TPA: bifunctional hydroxymethylpyrimidine kinase/phosphomethylpyrimidine kinase [Acidimicrobiales bacterium]|nr:bifunctional hydroxymethylpyrimidine kinase/phosphomethylpyrimidine kinase [Acidimicrobiales bacterium]
MKPTPVALTIAGTDSGGGAGVSADLSTFGAIGVWGTCAVTAVTAQNTRGVERVEAVSPDMVAAQIAAVAIDLHPSAAKTGMLVSSEHVRAVIAALEGSGVASLVVDPVLVSSTGDSLYEPGDDADAFDELLARATVVTPNLAEAARLTGLAAILDRDGMVDCAHLLVQRGAEAALVTGGHLPGDLAPDCLVRAGADAVWLDGPRFDAPNDHGSGCVLSAAICAYLAKGDSIVDACRQAKAFAARAIQTGLEVGSGPGPADPLGRAVT